MSADDAENVQGTPTYPSFEELLQRPGQVLGPNRSEAFQRLVIRLEEPLSTAVSVMNERQDPDAPWEPYCTETVNGPVWHPISQELLCNPPISSIKTKVGSLSNWEQAWLWVFDDDDLLEPPGDGVYTIWGPPREGEEPDDDETGLSLMYHQGEHRPPNYDKPLVVTARDKPYLTVHEFLTVIHPYLVARRQDMLGSLIVSTQYDPALPADTKLIAGGNIQTLNVETEENWKDSKRRAIYMRDNMPAPGFTAVYPTQSIV
ncbi:hypothetical protein F5X68DRAFT_262827 [Plectosphaerella plurivora]|uniref:Uncharacterized protein n=1 Tax=Plectosphaerella plurivora TaxID=936078 RepID=A0A9P8V8V4_9PEZI|nr:hypothetical protein F5X68DRAFT_262827 [Plectosphaerella plurivora]